MSSLHTPTARKESFSPSRAIGLTAVAGLAESAARVPLEESQRGCERCHTPAYVFGYGRQSDASLIKSLELDERATGVREHRCHRLVALVGEGENVAIAPVQSSSVRGRYGRETDKKENDRREH
jgi:hypothetical protein